MLHTLGCPEEGEFTQNKENLEKLPKKLKLSFETREF